MGAEYESVNGTKRNGYLDYAKGFLMLMLVYGHCANALWGGFNPLPWKTVAGTFEMPLYMAMSGYLLQKSCRKKDVRELLYDKAHGILLPCVMWELPLLLLLGSAHIWFLHAVFICSVLLISILKTFKRRTTEKMAVALSIIGMYFIPSDYSYLSWMYPFLVLGYWIGEHEEKILGLVNANRHSTRFFLGGGGYSFALCCYFSTKMSFRFITIF